MDKPGVAFFQEPCDKSGMASSHSSIPRATASKPDRFCYRDSVCARFVATVLLLASCSASTRAQTNQAKAKPDEVNEAYLRERYTKSEYRIPMRDGVKLFTAVYAPKDNAQPYPILLTRTPYSLKPYGVDRYPDPKGPLMYYAAEQFIFVMQDVRGRYGSQGVFVHVRP